MIATRCRPIVFVATLALFLGLATRPACAKPTAAEALKLAPVQSDVDYDRPAATEVEKCVVDVETVGGISGWVVKTEAGQVLRRFLDSNGDNKVDQWCYFKDGIEIYRDIDANFNNKADQYRWLGTAGTRWALDDDEDLRIDRWKVLSAEEATAEIVAALRERDSARFSRVLLNGEELKSLSLSEERTKELSGKIAAALKSFTDVATRQKLVTGKSEWIHFGASRPGVVPAGTGGASKDLIVYDNVTTVVETDGKHSQLVIGTMIKVGDTWRVFDLPKNLAGDQTAQAAVGYFFQASMSAKPETPEAATSATGTVSPEMQKLITALERLDKAIAGATRKSEQARLNEDRAELLGQLVKAAGSGEDRSLWIKQFAETVSAAVQAGTYPEGVRRLESLFTQVSRLPDSNDLAAYVKFRHMTAVYQLGLQEKDPNFDKLNTAWNESLEQFVKDYGDSPDAADALLQLAISKEFSGEDEDAIAYYGRIVSQFSKSELAPKAAGAKRRLECVGKSISLRGKTTDGRSFDLASQNGKAVLIHYWATWCEPCKEDLDKIRALQAKYGKEGFVPVGVNLDNQAGDATAFLRSKPLPWSQLYETGGLDGRLATEMGVFSLPTMILVGTDGRVVNRNIHMGEVDGELKKLLR